MNISGKKFAITGAGRGLGAALAIIMADAGVRLVLLARQSDALEETAKIVKQRTGQQVVTIVCDLADAKSCSEAGEVLARDHQDLDGFVHNGAMWLQGPFSEINDSDIQTCIASAAIGSTILTRHVLPALSQKDEADILTVVSTSGLPNARLRHTSVAFRAAKAAQDGFVHGLSEELRASGSTLRASAIYPGDFESISPLDDAWNTTQSGRSSLTARDVVSSIMFMLNSPRNATIRSLVIE